MLIIHSPLVGPATVRPLAAALSARGMPSVAPDLRSAAVSLSAFCDAASAAGRADVVIAHSGSGAMLPAIADRTGAGCPVYVDAVLAGATTSYRPPPGFLEFVDGLGTVDGRLPKWQDWWPAETVVEMVPDEDLRRTVLDENPSLPRSFYDGTVTLPARWWDRPAGYVQLSAAYASECSVAQERRWPTAQRFGRHLDLVTRPDEVADEIVRLIDRALDL